MGQPKGLRSGRPSSLIYELFVSFGWHAAGFLLRCFTVVRTRCRSFCIRAARGPIGRRESNSPESRRRKFKLDAHFSFARLIGAEIDHAADQFFHGLHVLNSEKLADFYRQGQLYERPVRIHDKGMSLFRGYVISGSLSEHYNRKPQAHTLTSA